jgi:hypothetical protein
MPPQTRHHGVLAGDVRVAPNIHRGDPVDDGQRHVDVDRGGAPTVAASVRIQ